ncbi:iron ABC transporter permease, partial [Klebsiella pneumoniae]|nr:iron ABC transporter permease [Klebsiella pneumoniae]
TAAILILDEQTLLAMRTWLAGDLAGLNWSTLQTALVPALIGLGVALLIAPRLNVLALGDKVALGAGRRRCGITLCGVALSGFASAVTAAILILDEQTLLAMRTWLAGDLAGLNWSTLQT